MGRIYRAPHQRGPTHICNFKSWFSMDKNEFIRINRRVSFLMSGAVAAAFLGFVTLIGTRPDIMSGEGFVLLGILLIGLCVASVYGYGFWLDRLTRKMKEIL